MSHHFRAKGGTHFNFNSDLSGDVRVHLRATDIVDPHTAVAEFPAADLLEFVEWYRRTPGYGLDEEALGETLTEAERLHLERETFTIRKLLRIHDAQAERIRSLEVLGNHDAEVLFATSEREHALQARVKELEGEREPDIEPPGETIAKLLHEKTLLDVRVKELEGRGVPADGMCRGAACGRRNRALPVHSCPYREDVGGDPLTLCSCCEECQHECAMDV